MAESFEWVDGYEIVHPKKRAFLMAFAKLGVISKACDVVQIHRNTHHEWKTREHDERDAYLAAFEEAKDRAFEVLETEARRRAVDGVEEPVYREGVCVGTVTRYSDTMLIFLMKGLRPDVYRDNYHIEHSGKFDLAVEFDAALEKARQRAKLE